MYYQHQGCFAPLGIILVILGTLVIKELMARFSFELGNIIDSKALKTDAPHRRSDVFTTALVIVALIFSRFDHNRVDGVMGYTHLDEGKK